MIPKLKPDPTFYPSPRLAMQGPAERVAYVAGLRVDGKPDSMSVVDLDEFVYLEVCRIRSPFKKRERRLPCRLQKRSIEKTALT